MIYFQQVSQEIAGREPSPRSLPAEVKSGKVMRRTLPSAPENQQQALPARISLPEPPMLSVPEGAPETRLAPGPFFVRVRPQIKNPAIIKDGRAIANRRLLFSVEEVGEGLCVRRSHAGHVVPSLLGMQGRGIVARSSVKLRDIRAIAVE